MQKGAADVSVAQQDAVQKEAGVQVAKQKGAGRISDATRHAEGKEVTAQIAARDGAVKVEKADEKLAKVKHKHQVSTVRRGARVDRVRANPNKKGRFGGRKS